MQEVIPHSCFTDFDISLFKSGKHYRLFEKFGSHIITIEGKTGVYFAVWAPSAKSVAVIGDFNYWDSSQHTLNVRWDESGIWEGFIPNVKKGDKYKYHITSNHNSVVTQKADPYALLNETPPKTASIVWEHSHKWTDGKWMKGRKQKNSLESPYSVYELHLDSWRRGANNERLTYKDVTPLLVNYIKEMNFTHVEFMPIMEYPFDPSWGYQITGYFAPTSRFGNPEELMFLIQELHKNDIGVILDWVPSHFPDDAHGLGFFDGSNLYEHPDRKKGYHPDWKSLIFNYERNEVRAFLISNATYWLEFFHADGLRVDAVASMLYLDYSREDGEWDQNEYGGNENLAAISFFKELNIELYRKFDGAVQTIAEESTSFHKVSKPVFDGGLGFGMKWMMGWMHDTLQFFQKDPIHRSYHLNDISFSLMYAFTENFMLPLSHDEVVHGKGSLLSKMAGDEWQRFANLRLLFTNMFMHPGSKLLFMGAEFGQYNEWQFNQSLDWHLLDFKYHKGLQTLIKTLNTIYKTEKGLHQKQFDQDGFEWIAYNDTQNTVISYLRHGKKAKDSLLVVCNFTPTVIQNYRIGLPKKTVLTEIISSDAQEFGGSGIHNKKEIKSEKVTWNGKSHSAEIKLPPLSGVVFKMA